MNLKANFDKGITLIALVITIIVLLILPGVSIAMLTGENGIINRAVSVREATKRAEIIEKARTDILDIQAENRSGNISKEQLKSVLDKYFESVPNKLKDDLSDELTTKYGKYKIIVSEIYSGDFVKTELKAGDTVEVPEGKDWDDEKVNPTIDEKGNIIPIPKDFYYVGGSKDEGVVISDKENDDMDNTAGGNQFVWVPCSGKDGEVTYEKKNGLAKTWREKYIEKQQSYTSNSDGEINENTWKDDGGNEESVDVYGGFYVARYEAGVPSSASFYADSEGAAYSLDKNIVTEKPVSKKNNQCWNYIAQENAVIVSNNMYSDKNYVKSSLIDSYAWDTIVEWMDKTTSGVGATGTTHGNFRDNNIVDVNTLYALLRRGGVKSGKTGTTEWITPTKYKKGKITTGKVTITESNKGDYEWEDSTYDFNTYNYEVRMEIATGSAEETKINNIYDMTGNMWEWTTEKSTNERVTSDNKNYCVIRGASFYDNGSRYGVAQRHGDLDLAYPTIHVGFRVVLYIS